MILAHKIRLYPKPKQVTGLAKACGVSRYTWNWALDQWYTQYTGGLKPNAWNLKKQWNQEKPKWVYESPKDANQQPFSYLSKAWRRFFEKKASRPTFKKKGVHDSFYVSNDKFHVENRYIRIPHIGVVKMAERLRFGGKVLSATVSRDAHIWCVSISVEVGKDYKRERTGDAAVGIDLGVSTTATLSTGEKIKGPKPLNKLLGILERRSRQHSRKKKGSNNRRKSVTKLARLHRRIRCQRHDFLHKLTSRICRENQSIVIEDLNVKGMLSNHRLARAISDIGMGEFRRQLEYKSVLFDTELTLADRWFPSTKLCRMCGSINDMPLSQRTFRCDCGHVEDRDINAARNLLSLTRGYRGINACGHESSGLAAMLSETVVDEAGTSMSVNAYSLALESGRIYGCAKS